jgi:hypothetical protein
MRRRQWILVTLSLVLLTVALAGVRMFGGSGSVASAQVPQMAIDMVEDTGWCNTIDSEATHVQGAGDYQVAICLLNSGVTSTDFGIQVLYDSGLNSCSNTGQTGAGLDANPDFVVDPVAGYNCSNSGLTYPSCGAGVAFIGCNTVDASVALTGNWAIAVITFHVIAGGDDSLTFGTTALYNSDGENIVRCPGAACLGATDHKSGGEVEPTATSTLAPTATNTPSCGGTEQPPCPTSTPTSRAWTKTPSPGPTATPGGEPTSAPPPPPPPPSGGQQPSVTPPSTGTGSGGNGWVNTLMFLFGSGAALSLAFGGGLYFRRVRNR